MHWRNIFSSVKVFALIVTFITISSLWAQDYLAPQTLSPPVIDGLDTDSCWDDAEWIPLKYDWFEEAGQKRDETYDPDEFSGRFKVVWADDKLFVLVEITDDVLNDDIEDPLIEYWEEDCLEIFVDENLSRESMYCNHNALAYHMAINSIDAIDINNTDCKPFHLNDFIKFVMKEKTDNIYIWEAEIPVYTDAFSPDNNSNETGDLFEDKQIGFSVAYCEDDGSGRENFFGSVTGGFMSSGDEAVLGTLQLKGPVEQTKIDWSNQLKSKWAVSSSINRGILTLILPTGFPQKSTLYIKSVTGSVSYSREIWIDNIVNIDVSSIPGGLYLLQFDGASKELSQNKLFYFH